MQRLGAAVGVGPLKLLRGGCCAGKTPAPAAAPPKPEPAEAARKPPPGTSTKLVGHNPERRGSDPEMAL